MMGTGRTDSTTFDVTIKAGAIYGTKWLDVGGGADGMTFVIQGQRPDAIGLSGG